MARIYVASTPATRGEPVEASESVLPEGMSEAEVLELLEAAAAELGLRLVPLDSGPDDQGDQGQGDGGDGAGSDDQSAQKQPPDEPAGNASTEVWVAYARSKGATDADLVDEQGTPLGQRALRDKFGTPTGA